MKNLVKRAVSSVLVLVGFMGASAFATTTTTTAPDYSSIISGVDFSTVITGVISVAAVIAGVLVARKGARLLLGMIGR